ncbi:hypothetical protein GCM10023115_06240 [Pontixanthobacter gangjinensis]|uniref:O-antigen ligase n=1 Tax=Pontixanthobacter gangjinensis TaxID=1028742 RepID=A0A6I4SJM0_9SPHN|nr:hypothetical protein [Pontixanthobacter gangjinensis]MXO55873.1 hypothetical protein [Pontixanthobacter gangjinensis]
MSLIASQVVERRSRADVEFDPWMLLAFLYPLSKLVMIDFIGQLYLTDILGVALLIFMIRSPDFAARLGELRLLLILMGLWLASLIITDLLRQSAPEDFLRGWAKIIFFGVQIAALWLFLPRRRGYLIAFALGSSISWGLGVSERFAGYEWKFGYDRAAAFFVIGLICVGWRRWPLLRTLSPALLGALAIFVLFQNARSSFITILLAAGICGLVLAVERWPALQRSIRAPTFGLLLLVGAAGASLVNSGYASLAESGGLGAEARAKYAEQTAGDVPLIFGGRSESLISVKAIGDSPVIGHGSWAKDRRYVELYRSMRLRLGLPVHDNYFQTRELIPTHSYVLGAWVEAGALGALFWLYVLGLPFVAIYQLLGRNEPLLPLVAYLSIGLVWAIPFSPFGATERFIAAYQIVVLMWVIRSPSFVNDALKGRSLG